MVARSHARQVYVCKSPVSDGPWSMTPFQTTTRGSSTDTVRRAPDAMLFSILVRHPGLSEEVGSRSRNSFRKRPLSTYNSCKLVVYIAKP